MIEFSADAANDRQCGKPGDARKQAASKFLFYIIRNHLRDTFTGFNSDIADKTIAHDDVYQPRVQRIAFDITIIIQITGAQQFSRLLYRLSAFNIFHADIEQSDAGMWFVLGSAYQNRPHNSKLQQLFRGTVHIGADIEQMYMAMQIRKRRHYCRPVYYRQGFEDKARDRHQRPGVACTHTSLGYTLLHQINRYAHGRIFFCAQRLRQRLIHRDKLRGMVNDEPFMLHCIPARQFRHERIALPNQNEFYIGLFFYHRKRGWNNHAWAVIAPHGVKGNGDNQAHSPFKWRTAYSSGLISITLRPR